MKGHPRRCGGPTTAGGPGRHPVRHRGPEDPAARVEVWDTHASCAQALHTRLGIGADGDDAQALELLARIPAGR